MSKSTQESWAKTAVVYQIYPRSFKDSNHDGIGDLNGIIEKLDYLNDRTEKSLGIDAIWISPVYKSPMLDFGYDVTNHCDIDPIFGTLDDFDRLISEAHTRNIKVIMDYIPGHTSLEHPWFIESRSSRSSPKRDWYIWKDPKNDGSLPNNWIGVFGGSRWEWDEKTKQYYLHTFLKEQPDLNWRNPAVKEAMIDVLRFWLKRGVDGFRIDSFNDIYKHDKFLDEPLNPNYRAGKEDPFYAYQHIYTRNQPERNELIKVFGKVMSEYGDKFMITESYVDLDELVALYEAGDSLHAPFNFQFIILAWEAKVFKNFIDNFDANIKAHYLPTYVLGNHDQPRVVSRLGEEAARTAAMLQMTVRGMPTVYYGEELGMQDCDIPFERTKDPFTRLAVNGRVMSRDSHRTPMQWTDKRNAGFTTGEPWLPIGPNVKTHNVQKERMDQRSMFNLYRKLLHIRRSSQALLYGTYQSLQTDNHHIFAFLREVKKERMIIILNFSSDPQKVVTHLGQAKVVCDTSLTTKPGTEIQLKEIRLRSHEGIICRVV